MRHLAVARLWYAANSFSPVTAGRVAFEQCEWRQGTAAVEAGRGAETELAAVVNFIAHKPDWQVTTLRCASAVPAGPMDDGLFTEFYDEVMAGLGAQRWDAVYLSLHGAALTTRRLRPELSLIAAVRNAIGDAALGASFDMHANLASEAAQYLTYASGYRTHPHVDRRATAARVLDRLSKAAEGRLQPVGAVAKVPALLPSFNMRAGDDQDGPMAEVQALARVLESGALLDVSAFGGFVYADTSDAGAAGMAFADNDPAAARRAATMVAEALMERRPRFDVRLPSPRDGIARALVGPPGLVCVTDPGDNPLSGGLGDTPGVFRALVAANPGVPTVFAFFCDPVIVARACGAGVGAALDVELGGSQTADFGPPVQMRATVQYLTGGRYTNYGPMERGLAVDLGRSVVLEAEGIQVIVTETCQPANDPAFFALHGIDLEQTRLLVVKAKNHFRAGFADRAALIVDVDAPGPACRDLSLLPYRKVPMDLRPQLV
jgi:microcystin degradation protein MlrC